MTNLPPQVSTFALLEKAIKDHIGFSSTRLVIDEIIEIAGGIPDHVGSLSSDQAEHLAGRFLKGCELCGDLYAIALGYELQMEAAKKREYGQAILHRAKDKGYKTAVDKTAYVATDESYQSADKKYNDAKMFRVAVAQKHQLFEKAHYHMRKLADRDANVANGRPNLDTDLDTGSVEVGDIRQSDSRVDRFASSGSFDEHSDW